MSFLALFVFPVHFPSFVFPKKQKNKKKKHFPFIVIRHELYFPPTHNPLMKYSAYNSGNSYFSLICFPMNMCVQIILCFSIYVPLYRIYLEYQVGTSSLCHDEGVDDVNEAI